MLFLASWIRENKKVSSIRASRLQVWRIARAPEPWRFAPWEYAQSHRFDGRWDDPEGVFRTVYASSSVYGCALELLAHFRLDPALEQVMAGIELDSRDMPSVAGGNVPQEWLATRCIGRGRLSGEYLKVADSRTISFLRRTLRRDLDASALTDSERRRLTQDVASYIYRTLGLAGIRYASRHGDDVELYAVFERPVPMEMPSNITKRREISLEAGAKGLSRAMELMGLRWSHLENESLPPVAIQSVSSDEMAMACFPPDGIPRTSSPLGSAQLWISALGEGEIGRLRELTWKASSWDFHDAQKLIGDRNLKQKVVWPVDELSDNLDIAYVGLVDLPAGQVQYAALAPDILWLTMVSAKEDEWKVWGYGQQAKPEQVRR